MINVTSKELLEKVDSTYTLCNMIGKRARQLVDGDAPLAESDSKKPVSIAAIEVAEGKITYIQNNIVYNERSIKELSTQNFV